MDHDNEQWRPVIGYEDSYEVSDCGRVRSLARVIVRSNGTTLPVRERILPQHRKSGRTQHRVARLHRNGAVRVVGIHRLVLEAFVGPCPDGQECCHRNDIADDNRLENLRWDTPSANQYDKVRNRRHHNANKTHCLRGHEFTAANTRIRTLHDGRTVRVCRTCHAEKTLAAYYRRKEMKS